MKLTNRKEKRLRRHTRIRAKISGTLSRPRLSVSRSSKHIYLQLIDDNAGKTIFGMSDTKIKKGTKTDRARELGRLAAKQIKDKKIDQVVFDRGGNRYHGRVAALAGALRKGGLKI